MGSTRTRIPAVRCAQCEGPMPAPAGRGRPPIYCRPGCRKAAYDARRARTPAAFNVKIVATDTVVEHDLNECVERVLGSPVACRKVLNALARKATEGTLASDPKWGPTVIAAGTLNIEINNPRRVGSRRW